MISFAIDLGGTAIKLAAVQDGTLLRQHSLPVEGLGTTVARMDAVAAVLRGWQGEGIQAQAAGIAFAGITDPVRRAVLSVNGKYLDAGAFDFPAWAAGLGLELAMDNDANAALLGESRFGAAKGCGDAVILILGTGIGTAALMDGRILHGRHFQAGCLGGHFTVAVGGRRCNCGGHGCAEAHASTWALPGLIREQPDFASSALNGEPVLDFRTLTGWARKGDALAVRMLEHCLDVWTAVVKNLVHAYDPEVVVLSGGVLCSADLIVEPLRKRVLGDVWAPWGTVDFRVAHNPESSALLGVHALACERINCR